ncbi:MAG: TolC family protein [Fidelibacterota bacterium]|nr:MAG: TolC family protein [Candidatus Neomarinimicrobiota bacterium]
MKNLHCLCAAIFLCVGLLAAQSGSSLSQTQGAALTLDQLIEIGLDNNSQILIAERNLRAARAGHRRSYSGLIPYVTASFSRDMDPGPGYFDPSTGITHQPEIYGSGLTVRQTIFDGVASWYSVSSGRISLETAQQTFDYSRQQVVLGIKRAYFDLLSQLELLEVAQESLELSRRQLELVEERYRLKAAKLTDLLKAQVSVGRSEETVYNRRQDLATATTNLNVIIGQDPAAPVSVMRDSVVLEPVPERTVALASMEANNPFIKMQELAVTQARLDVKKQRGVLMPSVDIAYSVRAGGPELNDVFSFDFQDASTTALGISVPIFTGLRNTSQYSQMRYWALAEEERLDDRLRDMKKQLEDTLSGLESLHRIHPINQAVLASAEADARLADEQYSLGAISVLDLLTTQLNLVTARSTLVQTTYRIKIAEAQLTAIMGTIGQ